jgi:ATP-dependent Clp protease ATP-binding subunit ClpA
MSKVSQTKEFTSAVHNAAMIAHDHGHEFVTLEHFAYALLESDSVKECLTALGIDSAPMLEALNDFFNAGFIPITNTMPTMTTALNEVITRCVGVTMFSSRSKPNACDLLLHMLQYPADDNFAITLLIRHGLTSLAIKRYLSHGSPNPPAMSHSAAGGPAGMGEENVAIGSKEEAEKFLAKYCVNLNEQAGKQKIDPLIGRADEVLQMMQVVSRRNKNNVILVGEPGVGKTSIVEGLALLIVRGDVPEVIKKSTVYSLDIGNLIAGTRFRGDFEERMKGVLKSLEYVEDPILFIDEIHTIMGAGSGSQGALDVANLLKPSLARGTLRCVGTTTLEDYRKYFEKDRALLRRFKRIDVYEPSIDDSKAILRGLREYYQDFHKVTYTDAALDAAVDLTSRYIMGQYLPDKAIDVIDNAGARQRIAPEAERLTVIDIAEVELEVSKIAKIPAQDVKEDETEKLVSLKDDLLKSVFGQDSAVASLVSAIFVTRAGLREENKPSGCYLFTGPTGVGKTEVARQLSKSLGVTLVKYDMSEYMEKHSVAKLIGSPPGYVGYGEGGAGNGKLVNDVDQHPYCVLLLDEIEKAHPDVFNILLQVMDDGKLTNSSGKSVSFRNVILIMTSNAGAKALTKRAVGFTNTYRDGADLAVINDTFSPEFRNRLDAIVRFNRLAPENVTFIVDKFIAQLAEMTKKRNVDIEISEAAKTFLAEKGFDPEMGARPLGRVINEKIKIPLSEKMLLGSLKNGGVAKIELVDGDISIQ